MSGVINFALEGMMLVGAFGAVWATYATGSPWIGLLGGAAGGALIGILHALASVKFRSNQIVSSISLNLLAAGATGMLLNQIFDIYGTSPAVNRLPEYLGVSALTPAAFCIAGGIMGLFRWGRWGLDFVPAARTPRRRVRPGFPSRASASFPSRGGCPCRPGRCLPCHR